MSETTKFATNISAVLAREFAIKPWQVENTVALLDEGATIPFIARYRKEKTGELDDQTIRNISDRLAYLRNMDTRKQEVYTAILGQER